jgi:hypothetical protein
MESHKAGDQGRAFGAEMNELSPEHELDREDRRNERRRRVLLFGKLSDATGVDVVECAISNLSKTGAQVRLYTDHSFGDSTFLIDAKTSSAHLAKIIWRQGLRWGLRFTETYDLQKDIPAKLAFLKRLLIETKLRQVGLLEGKGFTLDEALDAIGATRTDYERWRRESFLREETRAKMERLMNENAEMLRTLANLPDE